MSQKEVPQQPNTEDEKLKREAQERWVQQNNGWKIIYSILTRAFLITAFIRKLVGGVCFFYVAIYLIFLYFVEMAAFVTAEAYRQEVAKGIMWMVFAIPTLALLFTIILMIFKSIFSDLQGGLTFQKIFIFISRKPAHWREWIETTCFFIFNIGVLILVIFIIPAYLLHWNIIEFTFSLVCVSIFNYVFFIISVFLKPWRTFFTWCYHLLCGNKLNADGDESIQASQRELFSDFLIDETISEKQIASASEDKTAYSASPSDKSLHPRKDGIFGEIYLLFVNLFNMLDPCHLSDLSFWQKILDSNYNFFSIFKKWSSWNCFRRISTCFFMLLIFAAFIAYTILDFKVRTIGQIYKYIPEQTPDNSVAITRLFINLFLLPFLLQSNFGLLFIYGKDLWRSGETDEMDESEGFCHPEGCCYQDGICHDSCFSDNESDPKTVKEAPFGPNLSSVFLSIVTASVLVLVLFVALGIVYIIIMHTPPVIFDKSLVFQMPNFTHVTSSNRDSICKIMYENLSIVELAGFSMAAQTADNTSLVATIFQYLYPNETRGDEYDFLYIYWEEGINFLVKPLLISRFELIIITFQGLADRLHWGLLLENVITDWYDRLMETVIPFFSIFRDFLWGTLLRRLTIAMSKAIFGFHQISDDVYIESTVVLPLIQFQLDQFNISNVPFLYVGHTSGGIVAKAMAVNPMIDHFPAFTFESPKFNTSAMEYYTNSNDFNYPMFNIYSDPSLFSYADQNLAANFRLRNKDGIFHLTNPYETFCLLAAACTDTDQFDYLCEQVLGSKDKYFDYFAHWNRTRSVPPTYSPDHPQRSW
jgi:hypothetical protein